MANFKISFHHSIASIAIAAAAASACKTVASRDNAAQAQRGAGGAFARALDIVNSGNPTAADVQEYRRLVGQLRDEEASEVFVQTMAATENTAQLALAKEFGSVRPGVVNEQAQIDVFDSAGKKSPRSLRDNDSLACEVAEILVGRHLETLDEHEKLESFAFVLGDNYLTGAEIRDFIAQSGTDADCSDHMYDTADGDSATEEAVQFTCTHATPAQIPVRCPPGWQPFSNETSKTIYMTGEWKRAPKLESGCRMTRDTSEFFPNDVRENMDALAHFCSKAHSPLTALPFTAGVQANMRAYGCLTEKLLPHPPCPPGWKTVEEVFESPLGGCRCPRTSLVIRCTGL